MDATARREGWAARLKLLRAFLCFQTGDAQRGVDEAGAALAASPGALNEVEHAAAYALSAWLQLETGALEGATATAVKAAELADATGDLRVRSFAVNVLGVIFWGARLTERAIELCAEAVTLAELAEDPSLVAWWLVNLGGSHAAAADAEFEEGRMAEGARHMREFEAATTQALRLARGLGDIWTMRLCLANLADAEANVGRIAEAEALLDQYRALGAELPRRDREHYLDVLATVLIRRQAYDAALAVLAEGRALAESSGNIESLFHNALHHSAALEGLGRYREALEAYKLYHRLHLRVSAEHARRTARLADVALEADRLRRQAASLAASVDRDPLTGVYNRRRLDVELRALGKGGGRYLLAMVDIDAFKAVNDQFGHFVGDEVLQATSALLKESARPGDVVARFGGEEFVFLAEDMGSAANLARLEALRTRFAGHDWGQIAAGLRVTISIGAAVAHEASGADSVLKLADTRLYAAKRGGRNRVVAADIASAALQQAG